MHLETNFYNTNKTVETIAIIPSKMPIITNKEYQNAMTYNDNDKAYLQPLTDLEGLNYKDGILFFEGFPATRAVLENKFTKDNIKNFNLPILKAFYAIILNRFVETWKEDRSVEEVFAIYYPDLERKLGKNYNIAENDVKSLINSIYRFQNIMGIVDRGTRGSDILPVLVFLGTDIETNTIRFASPYMVRVIRDIYKASVRSTRRPLDLSSEKKPKLLPSHTYLPDMRLGKERNQKAVEIVCIVVATIEQTGNKGIPHISAKTIVERNPILLQSIENTNSTADRNKFLSRAFTKAWQLLDTHTDIRKKYKNIQLPDPTAKDFKSKWIPTMSTLDMVFEFPHNGKEKKVVKE